jgi:hypothetical protein
MIKMKTDKLGYNDHGYNKFTLYNVKVIFFVSNEHLFIECSWLL